MSMVGPRPLTQHDIHRLGWHRDDCARFQVKPGITGLSQLYAGRGVRLSRFLDQKYIEQISLYLDLKIITLSFFINLMGKRRFKVMTARYRERQRMINRRAKATVDGDPSDATNESFNS